MRHLQQLSRLRVLGKNTQITKIRIIRKYQWKNEVNSWHALSTLHVKLFGGVVQDGFSIRVSQRSAHIINTKETMTLLSMVRLGVDMGLINDIDRRAVNELFILTQPAHLQKIEGRVLSSAQRDVKRANLIRRRLEGK